MLANLPPGLTGLEQLQELLKLNLNPPMNEFLGISLVEVSDGLAVFEGVPGPQTYNPSGTVSGGYSTTLLDSACGCALHSKLAPGQGYTTIELKIAFHRAITEKTGRIRAEGRLLSLGRRVGFTEAKIINAAGRLFASATSSLLILTP